MFKLVDGGGVGRGVTFGAERGLHICTVTDLLITHTSMIKSYFV